VVIQNFWKCLQYDRLILKFKEIISKLEEIEGSLDDAFYSLPEYNANTDSRDYIDSARSELYSLKEDIEKSEKKT